MGGPGPWPPGPLNPALRVGSSGRRSPGRVGSRVKTLDPFPSVRYFTMRSCETKQSRIFKCKQFMCHISTLQHVKTIITSKSIEFKIQILFQIKMPVAIQQ